MPDGNEMPSNDELSLTIKIETGSGDVPIISVEEFGVGVFLQFLSGHRRKLKCIFYTGRNNANVRKTPAYCTNGSTLVW